MLAIEIDGDIHKTRQDYDRFRDQFLGETGITTFRFSNEEIHVNIEKAIIKIEDELLKH